MLKKATLWVIVSLPLFSAQTLAEQADNPFFKPSQRNPVEEVVDTGPKCDPEQKKAYEDKIAALEQENNLLTLRVDESSARISELEDSLQKAKRLEAQKFIGIVNDKAIFFDENNKVYIYKNKNEIEGELPQ